MFLNTYNLLTTIMLVIYVARFKILLAHLHIHQLVTLNSAPKYESNTWIFLFIPYFASFGQ